uniref:NIMA related kinase 3 n=1 Tax=Sinocyclocheilus rhinocerous TaxID=307959 RepID=A0A673JQN8_9TELE
MDQYSFVKVIGGGSFGRALLVQPINDEQNYVMKEIRLPKADFGIRNSRREAVLLSRMKHPNIVAFKDSFEGLSGCFIYCKCLRFHKIKSQKHKGSSLFILQWWRSSSKDTWFAQMCLGTKHIHDKRVLHRDLKSKNIFLTDSGTVKVGDFGSACSLYSAKAYAQTYVGTPYYVSPEIWDNKPYNNKSDVWSLGCVLYELCTLQHPFQSRSWKSLILKVCRGAYAPLPSHFSYELHYLIKHMFKTNPGDRPSVHTILSSHRVSQLLHKHLVPEVHQLFLEQSPVENNSIDDPASRKRWAVRTCNTVLGVLGNADIISTGSMENAERADLISGTVPQIRKMALPCLLDMYLGSCLGNPKPNPNSNPNPISALAFSCCVIEAECVETQERRVRKQWDKDPPERLLSVLEKAQLCYGFETYTIHRDGQSTHIRYIRTQNFISPLKFQFPLNTYFGKLAFKIIVIYNIYLKKSILLLDGKAEFQQPSLKSSVQCHMIP